MRGRRPPTRVGHSTRGGRYKEEGGSSGHKMVTLEERLTTDEGG